MYHFTNNLSRSILICMIAFIKPQTHTQMLNYWKKRRLDLLKLRRKGKTIAEIEAMGMYGKRGNIERLLKRAKEDERK